MLENTKREKQMMKNNMLAQCHQNYKKLTDKLKFRAAFVEKDYQDALYHINHHLFPKAQVEDYFER